MINLAEMKNLRLEPLALAMAALISLSACGGGGTQPMGAAITPATQGIAVGEPNPSAQVNKDAFIKMAQGAACSDKRNRLYIIDNTQVFWDVAGNCADASYSQTLFGATPDKVLCRQYDSIAGPRLSCTNPDPIALEGFGGLIKNRDKPNLGMDSTHKVDIVDLTPQVKLGNTVQYEQLSVNQYSGNSTVENLLVRDAKAWTAMWKRLNANMTDVPSEPWVDFDKKMVVVLFGGSASSGCSGIGVDRLSEQDGVLHVEYGYAPPPEEGVMCTMSITYPATAVVVDKFDNVKFEQIKVTPVKFKRMETKWSSTDKTEPFNAVVTDELKLGKLWSQYMDAATPMPSVDFSTQTVLFAWGGLGATCQSTSFTGAARAGGKLYAYVQKRIPGPLVDCMPGVAGSGGVIIIERSEEPVAFATSVFRF